MKGRGVEKREGVGRVGFKPSQSQISGYVTAKGMGCGEGFHLPFRWPSSSATTQHSHTGQLGKHHTEAPSLTSRPPILLLLWTKYRQNH